jgi:hypothetical protein
VLLNFLNPAVDRFPYLSSSPSRICEDHQRDDPPDVFGAGKPVDLGIKGSFCSRAGLELFILSTIVTEECEDTGFVLLLATCEEVGNDTPLLDVATAAHGAFANVERIILDSWVVTLSGGIMGVYKNQRSVSMLTQNSKMVDVCLLSINGLRCK